MLFLRTKLKPLRNLLKLSHRRVNKLSMSVLVLSDSGLMPFYRKLLKLYKHHAITRIQKSLGLVSMDLGPRRVNACSNGIAVWKSGQIKFILQQELGIRVGQEKITNLFSVVMVAALVQHLLLADSRKAVELTVKVAN